MSANTQELQYNRGDGVRSLVSVSDKDGEQPRPIEAKGYRDCGAAVLQSPDGVAVIHASPYILDEEEGKPTEYVIDPKETDLVLPINEALHQLYPDPENQGGVNTPLTDQQIDAAEGSLRVILVGGNSAIAMKLKALFDYGRIAEHDRPDGQKWSFPKAQERVFYDYGNGPKTILATPGRVLMREEAGDHNIKELFPPNGEESKFGNY